MKRLVLIALLAFAGWKGYQHLGAPTATPASASTASADTETGVDTDAVPGAVVPDPAGDAYQCDGRRYCSQMTSRAEAEFFVRHCPDTRMDGDGDGDPCENDSRF